MKISTIIKKYILKTNLQSKQGLSGPPGIPVEIDRTPTLIRWRYIGSDEWNTIATIEELVGLKGDDGNDGRNPEFQVVGQNLQYRLIGDVDWITIYTFPTAVVSWDDIQDKPDITGFAKASSVIEGDYSISADGTALYLPFNSTDYNFTANTIADRGPYTKNNGTLTNFTRNDGTVSGGVTIEGGAMKFNGTDGIVSFDNTITVNPVNDSFSLMFQGLNISSYGTGNFGRNLIGTTSGMTYDPIVIGIGAGTREGSLRFRFFISNSTTSGGRIVESDTGLIALDTDYDVMFTYNHTTQIGKIFLNHTEVASGSLDVSPYTTDVFTILGGGRHDGLKRTDGKFNFKFWRKEFTLSEFQNERNNKYAITPTEIQYSGRDFTWTTSAPATIIDTNMIVSNGEREGIIFLGTGGTRFINLGNKENLRFNKGGTWSGIIRVKGYGGGNYGRIFDKSSNASAGNGYFLSTTPTESLILRFSSQSQVSTNNNRYNIGDIFSFSVKFDGKTVKFYFNGVLTDEIDYPYLPPDVGATTIIGNRSGGGAYLDADLFDFIPSNRLWSEEEILAYSQRTKQLFTDVSGVSGSFGADELTTKEGVVMFAPNGNRFRVSIDNSGALTTTAL